MSLAEFMREEEEKQEVLSELVARLKKWFGEETADEPIIVEVKKDGAKS